MKLKQGVTVSREQNTVDAPRQATTVLPAFAIEMQQGQLRLQCLRDQPHVVIAYFEQAKASKPHGLVSSSVFTTLR